MAKKQSLLQRLFFLILTVMTGNIEKQIRQFQVRLVRTLTLLFVGLVFFAIGMAYVTTSLAKFLEAYFGLFALTLMGFVFILVAFIAVLLARQRS
jgi:hypothetical protein